MRSARRCRHSARVRRRPEIESRWRGRSRARRQEILLLGSAWRRWRRAATGRRIRRARGKATACLPRQAQALANARPPDTTERRSISTNAPVKGRSDQSGSAVTWNRISSPLTHAARRDQRGAVLKPRPGQAFEFRRGLCQNLLAYGDVSGSRDAEEGRAGGEVRDALRRLPRHRRAERARGGPQRDGSQRAFLCGEARAGEADQHAALFDPLGEPVAHRLVDLPRSPMMMASIGESSRSASFFSVSCA